MNVSTVLLMSASACAVCGVVSGVLIALNLKRHGEPIRAPLLGWLEFRNLDKYREMTLTERGRIGGLFYSYVVPFNLTLVLVVAALTARAVHH